MARRSSRLSLEALTFVAHPPGPRIGVDFSCSHPVPQVSAVIPNFAAIEVIAAHCEKCSA